MACPNCNAETLGTQWCSPCLRDKITKARADLDPCHCSEIPGPHRHASA